uniref:Uncharacterized protein n=1 Tax=Compsopogon caeruleus TaxID=31354 RepID=A0A7S1XGB6_9RHOD
MAVANQEGLGLGGSVRVFRSSRMETRAALEFASGVGASVLVYRGPSLGWIDSEANLRGIRVRRVDEGFPVSDHSQALSGMVHMSLPVPLVVENVSHSVRIEYREKGGKLEGAEKIDDRPISQRIVDFLQGVYLPAGFPYSVTTDYLAFTRWRVLQNIASAVMSVVSTEALLFGLGLGKKATAATAAATQWVLKDGLGYIGKVLYGYVAGKQFDHDPKSWRILSDTVEDVGGALELLTPLFPGNFLMLASIANALKGIAAMTGTATRHAIYKSLALQENQGDIATKGESQGVTCKMLGLALGILVSSSIGQNYVRLIAAYSCFGVVHLAANWQSMKCVQFATLNRQRTSILMSAFLQKQNIPDPYEVSHLEKIVFQPWKGFHSNIVLGSRVTEAVHSAEELRSAISLFSGEEYLISVPRLLSRAGQNSVRIVLSEQATPQDMLRAYFTAEYLLSLPESSRDLGTAHKYVVRNFPKFLRQVQDRGWNTQYAMLDPRVPRCKW